jgi:hypothetical protein
MALRKCPGCGEQLTGNNRQRYCSDTCSKRVRRNSSKMEPTVSVDPADWPSPFAATLAGLSIAQRHKLKAALGSDPRLAAQAQVPLGVAVELIALPPSELRLELGPTASLRPYGWEDGAAIRDFIERMQDDTSAK